MPILYQTKLLLACCFCTLSVLLVQAQDKPLQIIVIGAHPDDADLDAGGTAALWASLGHHVKFLSLTNGDAGHQSEGGGALAKRRRAEAQESARRLGIMEYETLDNHDGELIPSLEVRLQVIRRIRQWQADIVILPRPNDYHPDHRNTGLVVQDAAYMVIVPNVASDTPPLKNNPVFIYSQDHFQKPNPFEPDIVVNIDPVFERKIDGMDAHVSQFYEWLPWTSHTLDQVPEDHAARKQWLFGVRNWKIKPEWRNIVEKWYGAEVAADVQHVEAFEICEYGRQPSDEEIRKLFPMLGRPASVKALRTDQPLKIDGLLDESIYKKAPRVYLKNSLSKDVTGDPAYETYAQVAYDDAFLYVAFSCNDQDIYSSFSKRDEHLWEEEAVEVFIDTDNEPNNYVELEVSPKNILYDSYIVDPAKIDVPETLKYNLKAIKTAVKLSGTVDNRKDKDKNWTVEMAIPFAEIAKDFNPDQLPLANWKINFYRINRDASPLKYMAWRPTQGSFHQPQKFGQLIFR
ncbi:MAG: carbohydrate-binding family 9-like protein [Saprospiraceae bacterium]